MAVYVALLRGINVGGRHRLPMSRLKSFFIDAGCDEVRTYIQSGNVVLSAGKAVAGQVPKLVEHAIREHLGFDAPVITRTANAFASAARAHPFRQAAVDPKHLAVGFLAKRPTPRQVASLDPERSPNDSFVVRGTEIFLHFPAGVAGTKLTGPYLDAKLGTVTTIRNWRTVTKLAELCRAMS